MNKFIKGLLSIFIICFVFFLAGCDNNGMKQEFFQFIETLFSGETQKVIYGDHGLSVYNVTPVELKKHKIFLESKGFHRWNHLENSEGFLLKKEQLVIFTGETGKPIIYSVSSVKCDKYTPVILLDEKAMILYCILSTDLGG